VFAAELAMVTLVTSASSYWTAYEMDRAGRSPRALSFALGALFGIPALLWTAIEWRWQEPAVASLPDRTPSPEEEALETRIG
jgi:hypothetical protein